MDGGRYDQYIIWSIWLRLGRGPCRAGLKLNEAAAVEKGLCLRKGSTAEDKKQESITDSFVGWLLVDAAPRPPM